MSTTYQWIATSTLLQTLEGKTTGPKGFSGDISEISDRCEKFIHVIPFILIQKTSFFEWLMMSRALTEKLVGGESRKPVNKIKEEMSGHLKFSILTLKLVNILKWSIGRLSK